jgi:hypothetical protein
MKEVVKENRSSLDRRMDECCNIAESMIEEINMIALPEYTIASSANKRHKGSLKEKLLHKIRAARKVAIV